MLGLDFAKGPIIILCYACILQAILHGKFHSDAGTSNAGASTRFAALTRHRAALIKDLTSGAEPAH